MRLGFHQLRGRLGEGDLHPGGADASRRALEWLGPPEGRTLLEVGAGLGLSAARARDAGWHVTALEPDPILAGLLDQDVGLEVLRDPVQQLQGRTFDAILAESVLFAFDLPTVFPQLRRTLTPDGALVFIDMVWTEAADPAEAARIHDATLAGFGIACASRERWVWSDWERMLVDAGFVVERAERLGAGSPGSSTRTRPGTLERLLSLPTRLRHRIVARQTRTPPGWLESWMCMARA